MTTIRWALALLLILWTCTVTVLAMAQAAEIESWVVGGILYWASLTWGITVSAGTLVAVGMGRGHRNELR